jgi:hypothetical protein
MPEKNVMPEQQASLLFSYFFLRLYAGKIPFKNFAFPGYLNFFHVA